MMVSDSFTLRLIQHGSPAYHQSVTLRRCILRAPLGLDFTAAELAREVCSLHLAAYHESLLVGCLVLLPVSDAQVKIRQVAVREEWQRQGVGSALTRFAENIAKQKGWSTVVLHARIDAVPFYCKHGYRVVSEPFIEVTVPHVKMSKYLTSIS